MPARSKLSTAHLYKQVRDLIAHRFASGVWRGGAALPKEVDLVRELEVSAGTVHTALTALETDRLLRAHGTLAGGQASNESAAYLRNKGDEIIRRGSGNTEVLSQATGLATPIEQQRLQLAPGEQVVRTARRRRNEARIFMHEEACLATARFPGLAGGEAGNYKITCLARRHGIRLGRASETVMLQEAGAEAAWLLGIGLRTPLLRLERTVFTIDGLPVEWRLGLCLVGDGNAYVGEMS
jgi:GntR family transcriptional regulator